jgi:hypothetical protein
MVEAAWLLLLSKETKDHFRRRITVNGVMPAVHPANNSITAPPQLPLLQSQSYFTTDGQSASLSWDPRPTLISLHGNYLQTYVVFLNMGHPFWRENGSVIYPYNCYWALPTQLLWGPSPAELATISYCLISDWVPFLSPLMTRRAMMKVF